MNKDILINQLLATRATIDAALAVLAEEEADCPHEHKIELTTFGDAQPRYKCQDCGAEWTEEA